MSIARRLLLLLLLLIESCSAAPIRTAKQIEGLRRACRVAREILDKAHAAIKPGITTDEIDKVVRLEHC